jgi:hypothetical protein
MSCKFAVGKEKRRKMCSKMPFECPFQYYCTLGNCYKQTATKDKCKYYEEAENSEQLNKK